MMRKMMHLLLVLMLCVLPVCAGAQTITVDNFSSLYDALHEDEEYDRIVFGSDIFWNVIESGEVLPFEYDTVMDMAGHTLYVVIDVPDLIQIVDDTEVTIQNGTISVNGAYWLDDAVSVIGAYIRFVDSDDTGHSGRLILDDVFLTDGNIQPSSNPHNNAHTMDIIQMNGGDRLTIQNSEMYFRDADGNSNTSTLLRASGKSDVVEIIDSRISVNTLKNGLVNGTIICRQSEIEIGDMEEADGYEILGESMKLEMDNSEIELDDHAKGILLKDAQLVLKNESRIHSYYKKKNPYTALTFEGDKASIQLDKTSYISGIESSVPVGKSLSDYVNDEDGIDLDSPHYIAKLYTIRYFDGADGTIFPEDIHRVPYGYITPELSQSYKVPEGWAELGFTPQESASVKGDATYTMQWAKNGVVYYQDGMDGLIFETQCYVLEAGESEPSFVAADGGRVPVRDGYIFNGWDKSTDGTGVPVIYTAQWLAEEMISDGKQVNLYGSLNDYDGDGKVVISAEESYVQDYGKEEPVVAARISAGQIDEAINGEDGNDKIEEITIMLTSSAVTFDRKALQAIVDQAGKNEMVKLEVKSAQSSLTEDQKAVRDRLKAENVFMISLTTESGKTISDFGGGEVKIEIPFKPSTGSGDDYGICYLAPDGMLTKMPTEWNNGKMYVHMGHFSEYVVLHKSKIPEDAAAAQLPKTGDSSSLALWCMMLSVCSAGWIAAKRRHA